MKRLLHPIKAIKAYFVSRDIWKAKMNEPFVLRRPTSEEMIQLKTKGIL
jgi:hypothetical protein